MKRVLLGKLTDNTMLMQSTHGAGSGHVSMKEGGAGVIMEAGGERREVNVLQRPTGSNGNKFFFFN